MIALETRHSTFEWTAAAPRCDRVPTHVAIFQVEIVSRHLICQRAKHDPCAAAAGGHFSAAAFLGKRRKPKESFPHRVTRIAMNRGTLLVSEG